MRSSDDLEGGGDESGFLERGRRDPWIAGLASLVLPGAGQIYDSAAPHGFVLEGYQLGMYFQAGFHVAVTLAAAGLQFRGLEVEFIGSGGARVLTERDAQTGRILMVANALTASVTAFLEALWVNGAYREHAARMRMTAFFDPEGRGAGVAVSLAL
jgi:hypothetical protein